MKLNKKYLKNIILEVLGESEFYDKHKGMDTDYATQAMELGQSMSDEGSRNREEQVEKYVRLKVVKEIRKELISQTEWAARELIKEAAGAWGIKGDEINSSFYEDEMEFFTKRYTNRLTKSLELARAFDGTQEGVDAWTQEMMRVEKELYNQQDMGIHYLGSIIPYVLHIGDAFWQSYDDEDDPGWGDNFQKSVELQTAVKDAEDFYRPGIMKMVLKAQSADLGMDLGQMFGLNENEEEEGLDPEMKSNLLQLLSGDEEMIRQGLALADMLVPELMDKVDEMDSNSQLPMVFLEIFKSEIQKEVQKYYSGGSRAWGLSEDTINSIVADDSALWTTDRVPRKNDDYMGKTMLQVFSQIQFDDRRFHGQHLIVAALDILDERIEHVDSFLAVHFYAQAGFDIIDVLKAAFNDRSKLEPYIEKWKAAELVKLIK